MSAETMAQAGQLATQSLKVVDLAIEGDHVPATGGKHRLMALGRQVENGEPRVTQTDAVFMIMP